MIRYLNREEKENTRKLYETAFPEDPPAFVDFYYDTKMQDNLVIAEEQNGEIRSMAHLNPYDVSVRGKIYRLDYLVAVATDPAFRRHGLMRSVMERILNDLSEACCPFTFLEPADPAYYTPFDFSYISVKRPHCRTAEPQPGITGSPFEKRDIPEVLAFTNGWLKNHAEVFCVRDEKYLLNLERELRVTGGRLLVFRDARGNVAGTEAFDDADMPEEQSRMILADGLMKASGPAEPFIMGRLVNLQEFVKLISLVPDSRNYSEEYRIRVRDPIVRRNSGLFLWKLDRESSRLVRLEDTGKEAAPEYTVSELTSWLFGYAPCVKASWNRNIRTLKNIYFDEEI